MRENKRIGKQGLELQSSRSVCACYKCTRTDCEELKRKSDLKVTMCEQEVNYIPLTTKLDSLIVNAIFSHHLETFLWTNIDHVKPA